MLTNPTTEPILIVEDIESDIRLFQIALKRNGVTGPIQFVLDGQQAMDYLQGLPPYDDRQKCPFPHIIYMDLKMPRVNGFQLLRWIKNHKECSVVPLIVFTASSQDADIKEAYHLGANAYLVKPTNLNELIEMIRRSVQFWGVSQKPIPPDECV